MYGENFGDIFVHWFVFWKIPNQFLRAIPALLSFTANINYYMIIRISLNWAGICSTLRPHFLVQSTHSNSFDWLCRGSASSFPCPGGSQCQPEWLWPLAHRPAFNQMHRRLAPDPCQGSRPLNCWLFTFYWKFLTEILEEECLKDPWVDGFLTMTLS